MFIVDILSYEQIILHFPHSADRAVDSETKNLQYCNLTQQKRHPRMLISLGLHVVDDLLPGAGHDEAGQICLHADHLDVDQVPGDGLEHLVLRPLYVQYEPVDGWVTQGQQHGVEGYALDSGAVWSLLLL